MHAIFVAMFLILTLTSCAVTTTPVVPIGPQPLLLWTDEHWGNLKENPELEDGRYDPCGKYLFTHSKPDEDKSKPKWIGFGIPSHATETAEIVMIEGKHIRIWPGGEGTVPSFKTFFKDDAPKKIGVIIILPPPDLEEVKVCLKVKTEKPEVPMRRREKNKFEQT